MIGVILVFILVCVAGLTSITTAVIACKTDNHVCYLISRTTMWVAIIANLVVQMLNICQLAA